MGRKQKDSQGSLYQVCQGRYSSRYLLVPLAQILSVPTCGRNQARRFRYFPWVCRLWWTCSLWLRWCPLGSHWWFGYRFTSDSPLWFRRIEEARCSWMCFWWKGHLLGDYRAFRWIRCGQHPLRSQEDCWWKALHREFTIWVKSSLISFCRSTVKRSGLPMVSTPTTSRLLAAPEVLVWTESPSSLSSVLCPVCLLATCNAPVSGLLVPRTSRLKTSRSPLRTLSEKKTRVSSVSCTISTMSVWVSAFKPLVSLESVLKRSVSSFVYFCRINP